MRVAPLRLVSCLGCRLPGTRLEAHPCVRGMTDKHERSGSPFMRRAHQYAVMMGILAGIVLASAVVLHLGLTPDATKTSSVMSTRGASIRRRTSSTKWRWVSQARETMPRSTRP